jgi:RNA polymerase sigma-70 factor (ECF subfamily)
MPAEVWARPIGRWEDALSTRDTADANARFIHLAANELDRAYRLAGLLLRDSAEAEDATHEALLRAWRNRASLRDPGGFQAWFDRILVNVCRDRLRRRARVRFIPLEGAANATVGGDPFGAVLDRDEVLRAMAVLDDDERMVVVLHYWADLTLAAIAERLRVPPGTVKSRLHRALNRMAGRLR